MARPAKGVRGSRWNPCRIRNGQPSVASLGRYAVTYIAKRRQLGIRAAMRFSSENTTRPCADVFTTAEGNRNQAKWPAWGSTRSQRASHDLQSPHVNRGDPASPKKRYGVRTKGRKPDGCRGSEMPIVPWKPGNAGRGKGRMPSGLIKGNICLCAGKGGTDANKN